MTKPGTLVAAAMLAIVAALYWLPSHLAEAVGWNAAALEYVVGRVELSGLWLAVAAMLAWRPWCRPAAPVALWAACEAAMGAVARLALPMCCPLTRDARPLGVQAFGPGAEWLSLALAGGALWWVSSLLRSGAVSEVAHDRAPR